MNAETPDDSSEIRLRRYLLGILPEEEAVTLEDRYFEDADLFEEIWAAEHGLVDDYVAGRLGADEQHPFETWYLATTRHRDRVAVARALRTRSDAATPVAASVPSQASGSAALSEPVLITSPASVAPSASVMESASVTAPSPVTVPDAAAGAHGLPEDAGAAADRGLVFTTDAGVATDGGFVLTTDAGAAADPSKVLATDTDGAADRDFVPTTGVGAAADPGTVLATDTGGVTDRGFVPVPGGVLAADRVVAHVPRAGVAPGQPAADRPGSSETEGRAPATPLVFGRRPARARSVWTRGMTWAAAAVLLLAIGLGFWTARRSATPGSASGPSAGVAASRVPPTPSGQDAPGRPPLTPQTTGAEAQARRERDAPAMAAKQPASSSSPSPSSPSSPSSGGAGSAAGESRVAGGGAPLAADGRAADSGARTPTSGGTPARAEPVRPRATFALTLSPILVRSGSAPKQLDVPRDADRIALRLLGAPADARALVVEIATVEGRQAWSGAARPDDLVALATVPAARLAADDYIATLHAIGAGGERTELNRYVFRIARP